MLRIFKPQSAMSMGVYILTPFGMAVIPGALATELYAWHVVPEGTWATLLHLVVIALVVVSGLSGMLLATYTGVLLGATAVPAWHTHRVVLPLHFGIAGLGSAAGILELLGHRILPLDAISWLAIGVETVLVDRVVQETRRGGSRPARGNVPAGCSRRRRSSPGPLSLTLRACGLVPFAAGGVHPWLVAEPLRLSGGRQGVREGSGGGVRLAELDGFCQTGRCGRSSTLGRDGSPSGPKFGLDKRFYAWCARRKSMGPLGEPSLPGVWNRWRADGVWVPTVANG